MFLLVRMQFSSLRIFASLTERAGDEGRRTNARYARYVYPRSQDGPHLLPTWIVTSAPCWRPAQHDLTIQCALHYNLTPDILRVAWTGFQVHRLFYSDKMIVCYSSHYVRHCTHSDILHALFQQPRAYILHTVPSLYDSFLEY